MEEHNHHQPLLPPTSDHHQEQQQEEVSIIKLTWVESNKIWKIAGPSIFSRLSLYSLAVITQSFAGHLSDTDLAAISIATTVITSITFGFLLGMASALETLCGQAYGAKQYHMLGIYLQRSWVVLLIGSILLLPLFIFATPILKLTGQPEEVAELAGKVAMWLIPMHMSFVFQFSLVRFLQCQLKTAVIGWVSGLALVLHLVVNCFFVYKYEFGVVGAAIMLDVSWWVSVLGLFVYAVFGGCRESWNGLSMQAFSGLWEFFKLSAASSVMLALESFYYRVLVIVAGSLGNTEIDIDALSICITSYGWEIMIPYGFLAATGVRVANELGAGNAKGAIFATKISLLISILIGLFFCAIIVAFPDKLAMIFTSNTTVISMVNELSVLLSLTVLFSCIQPVFTGVALGCGWQSQVAIVNLGSYYAIGVPLGVVLERFLGFGIKGLWAGMLGGTVVQTLILAIITIRCDWNKQAKEAYSRVVNRAISS
ncbi:putative multi antimicrobial extrusion protein [Helianthus annuus]|uniref:Protein DETOXIFICATION n=1 Tax=Helianthus annuus TaxID=4232 RepID=A0A251UWZ8_HELAN|nr:protein DETOXIFICATION 27 isoform X1 [Helianthus annuus]KAF5807784.1 putative multi antimicrobial extrusion protein [Helianthus annuus]KAJ0924520.1 putative multi antimicrobial extrusion protein [Helianthus annuus]